MTDQIVDDQTDRESSRLMTPRATFRRLRFCGLSPQQAGNLTARLEGLRPIRDGWAVAEIERLVFLRWLVERGRFAEDSEPALDGGTLAEAATSA
jgi:hypothetical protein